MESSFKILNSGIILKTFSLNIFVLKLSSAYYIICIYSNAYSNTCLKRPVKMKAKNWFLRPIIA